MVRTRTALGRLAALACLAVVLLLAAIVGAAADELADQAVACGPSDTDAICRTIVVLAVLACIAFVSWTDR